MAKRDRRKVSGILSKPEILDEICCHVANGGTVIGLAELWDVVFGDISNWIHEDPERERRYVKALNARAEWGAERVLQELRRVGLSDIRALFDDQGSLLSVNNWPREAALSVSNIEVGPTGLKKLKLWDKLKALELLGKNYKLFTERHEHNLSAGLESIVAGSLTEEKKD